MVVKCFALFYNLIRILILISASRGKTEHLPKGQVNKNEDEELDIEYKQSASMG